MKKLIKAIAILAVAGMLTTAFSGVVLAAAVVKDGFMTVSVEERNGTSFHVPIPAALVHWAVRLAPTVIPQEELAQVRREVAPYSPALHAAANALEDCPKARLVDVRTDSETVLVSKGRSTFDVEVHTHDGDFSISIPEDTLSIVLNALQL